MTLTIIRTLKKENCFQTFRYENIKQFSIETQDNIQWIQLYFFEDSQEYLKHGETPIYVETDKYDNIYVE